MITKEIQEKLDAIKKEFNDNYCGLTPEITNFESNVIKIEIEWGDWKHEHRYADYIMEKYSFSKIYEQITEEDGSDCYSSIHYYLFLDE